MQIRSGETFLLIGDSITDAGRLDEPEGLGFGYVRMFRDLCWAHRPELDFKLMNRGVSGDTIRHLEARWHRDVIAMKPDLLSISIGTNDVWRQLQDPRNPEEVLLDEFEAAYRRLLHDTQKLVGCRLALCEATMIGEQREAPHNPMVDEYNRCIARLARQFEATLVPMNQAFWRVIETNPARAWTSDGVHPLTHGHILMALTLFQTLGGCAG